MLLSSVIELFILWVKVVNITSVLIIKLLYPLGVSSRKKGFLLSKNLFVPTSFYQEETQPCMTVYVSRVGSKMWHGSKLCEMITAT